MVHGGPAQKLLEDVQKYPDAEVQLVVPQRHVAPFAILPSVMAHGGPCAQTLVEAVQKNPEVEVQPVVPQRHIASLVVVPSICVQTGAERQRHLKLEEHGVVEEESVLKQRLSASL